MAAALSSAVNGGQYYKPYLVHSTRSENGDEVVTQPTVVRRAISEEASRGLVELMARYAANEQ